MVNLLSRVYNSTLGVPQQALYRMWRALKDEDIDVFSREGILAPELLPGIGIVFDHETDVQIEELVGDQGGFGNFLIDTALDPATYATLGASALGKVGRAVNMARNPKRAAGAKFSQYVGDLAQYETNADLAAKIAQGLGEGAIEGKHAQRALAELSGDFKGTTLMETLGASKQEEAVLTLPGLARMGAVWRAPDIVQNQGGWYRAMHNLFYNQRTGLRRPIDWTLTQATNGVRQLGPWGNTAADAMLAIGGVPSTFMKGFKTKKGAAQLLNLAADTPTKAADFQTEFGDLAGRYAQTDPDQLATDIEAALAEGLDEGEAILKAARKQGISGKAVEGLLEATTQDIPSELRKPYKFKPLGEAPTNSTTWYHGTGTVGLTPSSIDPGATDTAGLFGPGLYLTDNPAVAASYAKGRGKGNGTVYEVKAADVNKLDLEAPADPRFVRAVESAFDDIGDYFDPVRAVIDAPGSTGEQVYEALGEALSVYSQAEGVSKTEIAHAFDVFTTSLLSSGVDALQHTGGTRVGGLGKHNVTILLDPSDAFKVSGKQGIQSMEAKGSLEGLLGQGSRFADNVRDLQARASEASAALEEGKVLPEAVRRYNVPPEFADHELRAWAWKAGDVAGRLVRKGFRSDAPIESDRLEDLNRDRRDLEGMTQLAATSTVKKFTALKKRIAKDNGTDLETVNRAHLGWMQMFPHSSEFRVNLEALQSGDLSRAAAASRQLDEFTNRYRSSLEAVRQYAGVKSLEDLSKFLDATDVKRIVGPEAEHTMLRAKDVNNSKEVADLLRKPVGELDPNDIRRLRGQVKDPVTRARLVNMENRKRKGKTFNAAELPARVVGKATVAGKPVNGELPSAFADYLLATRDVKRALSRSRKEGGPVVIAPGTIARLDRAEAAMQEGARTLAREAFPKARQEDLDELFAVSGKVADAAMDVRTFERGAPLAYVPRISDRRFREKLGKVIGKANRVLGAPAEVDSMFRRVQQRDLTIEDLNELKETLLKENHPDIWKEVEDLVGPDLKLRPYVESYETGLLQQMTQQGAAVSTKRFIDDFFSNPEAAAKDGVVGGRITRIFDGEAQEITSGDKLKVSGKKRADVREVPIAQDTTPAYVELQLPNGQYQILDATQFKDRGLTLHALGKEGETLGDAVIRQEAIGGGRALGNKLEEGSWLITGQDSMVKFLQQTAIPQKHELSGVLAGYDAINFTIKKFQTVFRASHHAGNLLSGLAQTRAAGAGWKNTVLGHLDAAQMVMGLGPEGRRLIGDLEAIYGAESSLKTVQGAVNRANLFEGALAGKTVDEFGMLDTGGQVYGMTDIVRASAERNLFGGMQATQDIRLGGLDPQAAIRETERATATGLTGALETGVDIARLPEITARLSTVMALLREGHGLEDAIDMARLAHVDYSDLTKFERHGLKRAIPYYTFSRKYVPFALDRMAKDPSLIVGWQKAFENSDLLGIDEQGTPVLSYGTFEADIGRANANLDALMALAGTTEALTGMVGNPVQEVARPGFMSMSGGLASPVFAAVGLTQEQGASVPAGVQELWDSVFITRFVEGIDAAARGQGFQPLQDSALSWLFPANFTAEPEKARRFQVNMARRALSRLELQAQEAKTEAQLNSLRRQAEKIKSALRTVQEDF